MELVKFVATPFVLLSGGAFALLVIAAVIALGFGFFVGLPVMIFNQILTFDNALHVYRHQAGGLAGYIVRAVFWLRNQAMPDAPPDDSKGARMATFKEISGAPQRCARKHGVRTYRRAAAAQDRQACADHGEHALGQGRDADHPHLQRSVYAQGFRAGVGSVRDARSREAQQR